MASYTDEFRASCVLMLEAAGYPDKEGALTAVSNRVGVPLSTLSRWFKKQSNPPPSKIVNEKRLDLVIRLEEMAHMFVEAIMEDVEANGVDAVRAATALGITIDKLRLLKEQPTAIIKLQRALEAGYITPEQAKERWPNLADRLFEEAGINANPGS